MPRFWASTASAWPTISGACRRIRSRSRRLASHAPCRRDDNGGPGKQDENSGAKSGSQQKGAGAKKQAGVSIRLTATSEVWVCALAGDGTPVINGEILQSGTSEGPFRSGKFDLAFGNGAVDLQVNGKAFQVEDTPSPVGYEVTAKGTHLLQPGTRPDCT